MSKTKKPKPAKGTTKTGVTRELAKVKSSNGTPWDEFIGMFKDDPDFAEVKQIMAADRLKVNSNHTLQYC